MDEGVGDRIGGDRIGGMVEKGDSIAILGGDSDMVVQGLVVPPCITHNVFVILTTDNNNKYLAAGGGWICHQPL